VFIIFLQLFSLNTGINNGTIKSGGVVALQGRKRKEGISWMLAK
jgi:hypothetical protein